ncbi:MAG: hypothetical protein ABSA83_13585 [Verrucomicrobiota bacterium]|jgi:hypothetical protein
MILSSMMKFNLGRLVISPAALQTLSEDEICRAIDQHVLGQWGDVSEHERDANELALSTASTLLSVYHTDIGTEFRIMTTGDRFMTTVYLPSED